MTDGGGTFDGRKYAEYAQTATTQAAVLRSAAARIDQATGRIGRAVASASFSAPSAARFRERTGDALADLRADSARLTTLADTLEKMSQHYEDLYLAWKAGS
jgi:hypothetical protein